MAQGKIWDSMISTAGGVSNLPSKMRPKCCHTEIFCIPLAEVVNKGIKKKKSLVGKNKLGSFSTGELSIRSPTAPGYSVLYPTTIPFLSAQREMNLLQQHFL